MFPDMAAFSPFTSVGGGGIPFSLSTSTSSRSGDAASGAGGLTMGNYAQSNPLLTAAMLAIGAAAVFLLRK